jgi:hypothetical protein
LEAEKNVVQNETGRWRQSPFRLLPHVYDNWQARSIPAITEADEFDERITTGSVAAPFPAAPRRGAQRYEEIWYT